MESQDLNQQQRSTYPSKKSCINFNLVFVKFPFSCTGILFLQTSSVQATSRHPALSFSKSLPGYAYNNQGNLLLGESKQTQTGGKLKLSRAVRDTFALHDEKLRRRAQVWRNEHDGQAKKRKEDVNFNNQRQKLNNICNCKTNQKSISFRNFHFDDEVSLTSRLSNPEDHIYEEIDSDLFTSCDEEENEVEENFLLGISLERRNNLKFYGSAGWDFGN